MRTPHLTRMAAASELQLPPAIGPFFQSQYGDFLQVPPTVQGLSFLTEISAKTRERLVAQAEAHWRAPSLTHHACHELQLLEHRLPIYDEVLEARFDVSAKALMRAIKQMVATMLMTHDASSVLPEDFDLATDGLPLRLRAGLVTSLIDQSQLILDPQNPHQQRQALTAWLADVPQMLRGLVCSTPQKAADLLQADLIAVLSTLPLDLFADLLPQSTRHTKVYFPLTAEDGTVWNQINGVVYWQDTLILVDTNIEHELCLAGAADWIEQLNHLQWMVEQSERSGQFLRYLESAPEIVLYDHEHIELARLSRRDFRRVIRLSVTFNDMLAQMQRLDCVSALNTSHSLALSLHELACYRDLLNDPMKFVGFLEQRLRASGNPHLGWIAELDHLGMHHCEARYASSLDSALLLRQILRRPYQEVIEKKFVQRLHDRLSLPPLPPPRRTGGSVSTTQSAHRT